MTPEREPEMLEDLEKDIESLDFSSIKEHPIEKIINLPTIQEYEKRRLEGYENCRQRLEQLFSAYTSILKNSFEGREPTEEEYVKYECSRHLRICLKYNHPYSLERLVDDFKKRVESIYADQIQRGESPSLKKIIDNIKQNLLELKVFFKSMDDVEKFLEGIDERVMQTEVIAIRKAMEEGRDEPTEEDKEYASKIIRSLEV